MEKPVSEPEAPQSESLDADELPEIRYEKSPQFRVIHCDGAFGGLTPQRFFGMSLYAERVKPPDRIVLEPDEKGNLTERPVFTKHEIIREVEATVLLSLDQAESLGRWLLRGVQGMKENE
jgi:hypothetical protein